MEATIQEDEQIQKHFRLINSIVGIGMITAIAFLIYTQNFTGRRAQLLRQGVSLPAIVV